MIRWAKELLFQDRLPSRASCFVCPLQLFVENIAAVNNNSDQESIRWRIVRCLLASPPGARSVEGPFLVDGADSSRSFMEVSPDEGDYTGRIIRQGDHASRSGIMWLVNTRVW